MSNLQIIEELCNICEAQSYIIKSQASALEQVGIIVLEEERADIERSLTALIGCEEVPDNLVEVIDYEYPECEQEDEQERTTEEEI